MVFNTTFNNISVILWQYKNFSVYLHALSQSECEIFHTMLWGSIQFDLPIEKQQFGANQIYWEDFKQLLYII